VKRKYRICSGGRHTPRKGIQDLIVAMSMLDSRIDYQLRIFGEGPLTSYYKELIGHFGLESSIQLVGFVENIMAELQNADLFVLPSHSEGFGIVLLEAMNAGCKLVASDCDYGPREILNYGEFGTLVQPKNPYELAAGIEEEIRTPRDIGEFENMLKKFDIRSQCEKYLELIEDSTRNQESQ
jgi:Glycosyltransferase